MNLEALPHVGEHRMVPNPQGVTIIETIEAKAHPEPLRVAQISAGGWRVLIPENPIPIKRIILKMLEGPSHLVNKEVNVQRGSASLMICASTEFMVIASRMGIKRGDGYKASYCITWEDESEYQGRFCLGEGGREGTELLHEAFTKRLLWMAGLRNSAALNRHEALLQAVALYHENGVQTARNFLSSYEL